MEPAPASPRLWGIFRCLHCAGLTLQVVFLVGIAVTIVLFYQDDDWNLEPLGMVFLVMLCAWVVDLLALAFVYLCIRPRGRHALLWHCLAFLLLLLVLMVLPMLNRIRE
jgi:hypothetical protein